MRDLQFSTHRPFYTSMLYSDASGEIRKDPPVVSFLDHGFLFGDSLYEVVRSYERKLFGWNAHMERLSAGGQRLGIEIESLLPDIRSRAAALLGSLNKDNAALRMVITRGIGKLHIDPRTCEKPLIYMAAWELDPSSLKRPLRLFIPKIRRNAIDTLDPAIKSGNYLNNVLAFQEAVRAGFDDAVMLNPSHQITELTTSNIGWVKDGVVFTPSLSSGILHGITRAHFLKAESVREGLFTLEDFLSADEIFALSTFKEIVPILEISTHDGKKWEPRSDHSIKELAPRFASFIQKLLATEKTFY